MSAEHLCTLQPLEDSLEREWDSFALSRGTAPYLRPGWFRAWMGAFWPGQPLQVLTARRAGELVALLPLMDTRLGFRAPVNAETPGFELLSTDDAAIRALVPLLLESASRVDLRFMPVGAPEEAFVAAAGEQGCRVTRDVIRRSVYTDVTQSWETVRTEVLGRSRRKGMAHSRRKLAELGELSSTVHDGKEDLHDLLHQALALEAAGWKGSEGTAILSRPSTAQFYQELAAWAADQGLLRLHFLRLDGKPIAFKLTLEQSGVVYSLKASYDERLRQYGPGFLMSEEVLAYASAQPHLRTVETLGEDEPHKQEFATGVHAQLKISVFSSGLIGSAAWMQTVATDRLRAQARKHLSASTRTRVTRLARSARLVR
ncbi:GNAT family N-acetyltransferase [Arthrobacter sp. MSA 4-2]|uniref:GNAT family N-acetyltransferase n=1 Tax=Arthrobacter sp. MSA 4-2 TaxID=2794349 RepID=UPI0018E8627C|nr:GNAT family N-acetyltransferase [Arthrobacter sp. MSA 4-2]MBJ2120380.1 GNAT family N-acetyltransferase [Arthrobacter sp. MSA 4-2]